MKHLKNCLNHSHTGKECITGISSTIGEMPEISAAEYIRAIFGRLYGRSFNLIELSLEKDKAEKMKDLIANFLADAERDINERFV